MRFCIMEKISSSPKLFLPINPNTMMRLPGLDRDGEAPRLCNSERMLVAVIPFLKGTMRSGAKMDRKESSPSSSSKTLAYFFASIETAA